MGLCVQNEITILGLIVNLITVGLCDHLMTTRIFTLVMIMTSHELQDNEENGYSFNLHVEIHLPDGLYYE